MSAKPNLATCGLPTYDELKRTVQKLQAEGRLAVGLTPAERADWAYGNAVCDWPAKTLTRE